MRREKVIKFRVSYLEQKAIQVTAERVGMTVSDYCRKAALNKDVKMRLTPEQAEGYKTLQQFRSNFARVSNLIKEKGADADLLAEVSEVVKQIRNHLKNFEQ